VWASLGALQWQETVRTIRQRRALVLRNSPLRLWPVPMALVAWKESCCRTQQCLDQSTIFWLTLATWAQACTNHGIPFGQYSWLQICNGADAWSWIPNNARVSNNLCSRQCCHLLFPNIWGRKCEAKWSLIVNRPVWCLHEEKYYSSFKQIKHYTYNTEALARVLFPSRTRDISFKGI